MAAPRKLLPNPFQPLLSRTPGRNSAKEESERVGEPAAALVVSIVMALSPALLTSSVVDKAKRVGESVGAPLPGGEIYSPWVSRQVTLSSPPYRMVKIRWRVYCSSYFFKCF